VNALNTKPSFNSWRVGAPCILTYIHTKAYVRTNLVKTDVCFNIVCLVQKVGIVQFTLIFVET
jgi:hypothetical protein